MRKMTMASIWICSVSRTNRVLHYPCKSGLVERGNHSRPINLRYLVRNKWIPKSQNGLLEFGKKIYEATRVGNASNLPF